MSTLHTQYRDEIKAEQGKFPNRGNTLFTENDIVSLPSPVQRYFRVCGYIGAAKRVYSQIRWSAVELRSSPRGNWRKMTCYEYLAAPEPFRIVHLKTRLGGIIPFEAIDKYQGGHGNMLIKLAGLLTLQDARGKEMDQSALVTFLSECLLLPGSALQPYLRWSGVNRFCAAATIRFNGVEARGRFYFSDSGEFIRFETGDRWQAGAHGKFVRRRWAVIVSDYKEDGGIWRPRLASAYWINGNGPWDYFRGKIDGII